MSIFNRIFFAIIFLHAPVFVLGHFNDYEDLSYTFSEDTTYFPGQKAFKLNKDVEGWRDNTSWYSAYSFCMGEHGGTHLDAPYHFYRDGWTVDQIPQQLLIEIRGIVIDIESKVAGAEKPGDYALTVGDIMEYERRHGRIGGENLILIHTGWAKYWGNSQLYLGWSNSTDENGNVTSTMGFPGISVEAAKWLHNERSMVGIGIDTASIDPGFTKTFPVHSFLASKQVYILENVANLHLLIKRQTSTVVADGRRGNQGQNDRSVCDYFKFFVLPLKIVSGTGAPARILAQCFSYY